MTVDNVSKEGVTLRHAVWLAPWVSKLCQNNMMSATAVCSPSHLPAVRVSCQDHTVRIASQLPELAGGYHRSTQDLSFGIGKTQEVQDNDMSHVVVDAAHATAITHHAHILSVKVCWACGDNTQAPLTVLYHRCSTQTGSNPPGSCQVTATLMTHLPLEPSPPPRQAVLPQRCCPDLHGVGEP